MNMSDFLEICLQKHQYSITPIAISSFDRFGEKFHENYEKSCFTCKNIFLGNLKILDFAGNPKKFIDLAKTSIFLGEY